MAASRNLDNNRVQQSWLKPSCIPAAVRSSKRAIEGEGQNKGTGEASGEGRHRCKTARTDAAGAPCAKPRATERGCRKAGRGTARSRPLEFARAFRQSRVVLAALQPARHGRGVEPHPPAPRAAPFSLDLGE